MQNDFQIYYLMCNVVGISNLKSCPSLRGATRNGALRATTEYLYSQNYSKRVNGSLLTFTTSAA